MAVNKESFNPIEFWSETFPHLFGQGGARDLPPCLESCQDGKWANVRHFTLNGFIYRHFSSFSRESLPTQKEFTTNKTHGFQKKIRSAL